MHFAGGPKNKIYLQFPLPEDVEKRKLVGGDFAVGENSVTFCAKWKWFGIYGQILGQQVL